MAMIEMLDFFGLGQANSPEAVAAKDEMTRLWNSVMPAKAARDAATDPTQRANLEATFQAALAAFNAAKAKYTNLLTQGPVVATATTTVVSAAPPVVTPAAPAAPAAPAVTAGPADGLTQEQQTLVNDALRGSNFMSADARLQKLQAALGVVQTAVSQNASAPRGVLSRFFGGVGRLERLQKHIENQINILNMAKQNPRAAEKMLKKSNRKIGRALQSRGGMFLG